MNISVRPGERVHMVWVLPFTDEPASHVVLPMNGDELSFYSEGMLVASFNRNADKDSYWLGYADGHWFVTLDTNDTSFLLSGENTYEFVVYGTDNEVIVSDDGTVTLNG